MADRKHSEDQSISIYLDTLTGALAVSAARVREVADDPRFITAPESNDPEPAWLMAARDQIEEFSDVLDLLREFAARFERARHFGFTRDVGRCGDCGKSTPSGMQLTCDRCTRKLVGEFYRKFAELCVASPRSSEDVR